jgi:hypothetical protein
LFHTYVLLSRCLKFGVAVSWFRRNRDLPAQPLVEKKGYAAKLDAVRRRDAILDYLYILMYA